MQSAIKTGFALGLAAEAWTLLFLSLGMHTNPVTFLLFYLVILLQVGILFWGLKTTAREGKTYVGQVMSGLIMSAIGAVIVFIGSFILTNYLFPGYFIDVERGVRTALETQRMPEPEIQRRLDEMASFNTPLMNAFLGLIGTVSTGLIVSLIVGAFVKAHPSERSIQAKNAENA